MTLLKADPEEVVVSMPVDNRTKQPMGYLHGGASVALAESAASIGAFLNIDPDQHHIFGIEINANHMKGIREGEVTATAKPLHIGQSTMVWDINIKSKEGDPISISRCTVGVIPKVKRKET